MDHKERLIGLRVELKKALELEQDHEMWSTTMTQLLNSIHGIELKARMEAQRLQNLADKQKGTEESASTLADMLVSILTAHNRQKQAFLEAKELEKNPLPKVGMSPDEEAEAIEAEAERKHQELVKEKAKRRPSNLKRK